MNIQQMKYVVAVANNGSFREAAKKMFVSQPSLSAGIKELENRVRDHAVYSNESRGIFNRRRARLLKSCRENIGPA